MLIYLICAGACLIYSAVFTFCLSRYYAKAFATKAEKFKKTTTEEAKRIVNKAAYNLGRALNLAKTIYINGPKEADLKKIKALEEEAKQVFE